MPLTKKKIKSLGRPPVSHMPDSDSIAVETEQAFCISDESFFGYSAAPYVAISVPAGAEHIILHQVILYGKH